MSSNKITEKVNSRTRRLVLRAIFGNTLPAANLKSRKPCADPETYDSIIRTYLSDADLREIVEANGDIYAISEGTKEQLKAMTADFGVLISYLYTFTPAQARSLAESFGDLSEAFERLAQFDERDSYQANYHIACEETARNVAEGLSNYAEALV